VRLAVDFLRARPLPLRVIIPRAHDAGDGQIVAPTTS